MSFGGSPRRAPPPPEPPKDNSEEQEVAARKARRSARLAQGRESTIFTSTLGARTAPTTRKRVLGGTQ